MARTPEQRVVSIVNHLDQAMAELSYLQIEAPFSQKLLRKMDQRLGVVQQMAGRDLTREFGLPSSRYASETGSQRVASRFLEAGAGRDILYQLIEERPFIKLYREMENSGDEDSAGLLREISGKLTKALDISENERQALTRLRNCVANQGRWSLGLQRNNIFKAANLLGIKLPSGMF